MCEPVDGQRCMGCKKNSLWKASLVSKGKAGTETRMRFHKDSTTGAVTVHFA